ncbi:hypothetical protein B0H10DRAFT_450694 [Mycena sp. CBHHK59/15]|nr:hypothetical protein B0H10DRAFT_450694 [Mycena sp. CBHHK59/15]
MLETHLDRNHDEVHTAWEESNDKCRWRLLLLFTGKIGEDDLSPTTAISSELISPDGTGLGAVPVEPPQSAVTETVVPQNPLGPTARFPYLPAKSDYGGPDLKYSVRFGGPKIYDLLGSLPMEPFGVLAWAVLDREEEIFESDDIKDEYKVMHALWARWVTLNRNVFVADYFAGIKQFVDTYWKMIRWAAGWDALRYWLLMLMVNRFITGRDVAHILRYYEHKLEIAVIGKSDGI